MGKNSKSRRHRIAVNKQQKQQHVVSLPSRYFDKEYFKLLEKEAELDIEDRLLIMKNAGFTHDV